MDLKHTVVGNSLCGIMNKTHVDKIRVVIVDRFNDYQCSKPISLHHTRLVRQLDVEMDNE